MISAPLNILFVTSCLKMSVAGCVPHYWLSVIGRMETILEGMRHRAGQWVANHSEDIGDQRCCEMRLIKSLYCCVMRM